MLALIDLRRRIKSVRNTQEITQAMKTVSTAKFKKAQRAVLEARPYWHTSPELLERIARYLGKHASPFLARREEKKVAGVVISSDKGLCGAFNSNLLAQAQSFFEEKAGRCDVRMLLVGKKAVNFFNKLSFPVDMSFSDKVDRLTANDLKEISHFLMRQYVFNKTDAVYVAYNEFRSILSPRIMIARLLPLLPSSEEKNGSEGIPPDWEPGPALFLDHLLAIYIELQICHCFFESQAAEQAARMMAMENATKNAEELISDLILVLNKIRQSSITKELLEIMTAVEALAK